MTETDLQALRVWVTRPADQAQNLIDRINAAGGEALAVPTLVIVAPAASRQLPARAQALLERAQTVIFISRNAVDWLWYWLGAQAEGLCRQATTLAVGPATVAALNRRGIDEVQLPEAGADSEALLKLPALSHEIIHDARVVIVRGEGGRELLADTLRRRGASIEYLEVYRRQPNADMQRKIPTLWRDHPPAVIVASSPAGLAALLEMVDDAVLSELRARPLICLGQRLAGQAQALGFERCYPVAAGAGDSAVLNVLYELQSRDRHD